MESNRIGFVSASVFFWIVPWDSSTSCTTIGRIISFGTFSKHLFQNEENVRPFLREYSPPEPPACPLIRPRYSLLLLGWGGIWGVGPLGFP